MNNEEESPRFRKNTIEEKRIMRNSRRRRMRRRKPRRLTFEKVESLKQMKQKLEVANVEIKKKGKRIETLRCMTRTFWERWRRELEKRKEALWLSRTGSYRLHVQSTSVTKPHISEIDPDLLIRPTVNEEQEDCYLDRSSFGIVKLMMYRGMYVAVKQLHVKSRLQDLRKEAEITSLLCHPFLPYLYGIRI